MYRRQYPSRGVVTVTSVKSPEVPGDYEAGQIARARANTFSTRLVDDFLIILAGVASSTTLSYANLVVKKDVIPTQENLVLTFLPKPAVEQDFFSTFYTLTKQLKIFKGTFVNGDENSGTSYSTSVNLNNI